MSRSYNWEGLSVTDQEIARYERELEEGIDVNVEVEEGPYSIIEIEGEFFDLYSSDNHDLNNSDEERKLAKGVAIGRYLFEQMNNYQWDQEPLVKPIFSKVEPAPIEEAVRLAEIESNEYFRHGFLNQREISEELDFYNMEDLEGLTPSQENFYSSVRGFLHEEDLSASEVSEKVSNGEIEVNAASAEHRPWVADVLNELSDRGLVGRYRDGREVKFTASPERGFRGQVLNSDFDVEQKKNILETADRHVTESEVEELKGMGRQPSRIMQEFSERISWKAINSK